MARPKRLYKTKTGRSYYLIKGKRKYLKKDVVLPKKGGLTINIRNVIQKTKPKKRGPKKKTAYALNPEVPLGLPIHFAVEQKPITQVEDIVKSEVKKKEKEKAKEKEKETAIVPFQKSKDYKDIEGRIKRLENTKDDSDKELMRKVGKTAIRQNLEREKRKAKREEEAKMGPSDKVEEVKEEVPIAKKISKTKSKPKPVIDKKYAKIPPGSITANKKVRYNIDTLFRDFVLKYGDYDDYSKAWKKFQTTSAYFNPIEDSDEFYKSQPPFVYNYIPKFPKIKTYEGETSAEESGDRKKRNIEEERKAETSAFTESEAEIEKVKKRSKKKPESDEEDSDVKSFTEGRGASGLYNSDIEDVMNGLKNICPVITSDKVNMLLDYVKPGMKKFGAIVNTNPSTSDGSGTDGHRVGHWRAVFFDNDEDGRVSAEYFDPLCEGPIPTSLKKVMSKIAKKMNPEDYSLVKQNYLKRQMDTTNTCGYHAIKFIDDRYNDVDWSEATGYDDYMAKHKPDDSVSGEQSLIKPIKKYDKYI